MMPPVSSLFRYLEPTLKKIVANGGEYFIARGRDVCVDPVIGRR